MAYAASELGEASIDAFFQSVRANYLTVAGTYAVTTLVTAVLVVLSFVVPSFVFGLGSGGQGATLVLVFALVLLVLVSFVAIAFQFVGPAVVVEDYGVLGAINRSADLLTEAPLRILGYSLLRSLLLFGPVLVLVLVVAGAVGTMLPAAGAAGPTAAPAAGMASLGLVSIGGLLFAFLWYLLVYPVFVAYHVTFYRDVTGT